MKAHVPMFTAWPEDKITELALLLLEKSTDQSNPLGGATESLGETLLWCALRPRAKGLAALARTIREHGLVYSLRAFRAAKEHVCRLQSGVSEPELEPPTCPNCGSEARVLGGLGNLSWYRCRGCGVDFNHNGGA